MEGGCTIRWNIWAGKIRGGWVRMWYPVLNCLCKSCPQKFLEKEACLRFRHSAPHLPRPLCLAQGSPCSVTYQGLFIMCKPESQNSLQTGGQANVIKAAEVYGICRLKIAKFLQSHESLLYLRQDHMRRKWKKWHWLPKGPLTTSRKCLLRGKLARQPLYFLLLWGTEAEMRCYCGYQELHQIHGQLLEGMMRDTCYCPDQLSCSPHAILFTSSTYISNYRHLLHHRSGRWRVGGAYWSGQWGHGWKNPEMPTLTLGAALREVCSIQTLQHVPWLGCSLLKPADPRVCVLLNPGQVCVQGAGICWSWFTGNWRGGSMKWGHDPTCPP